MEISNIGINEWHRKDLAGKSSLRVNISGAACTEYPMVPFFPLNEIKFAINY